MLYTLNLYNVICQLNLNSTGGQCNAIKYDATECRNKRQKTNKQNNNMPSISL